MRTNRRQHAMDLHYGIAVEHVAWCIRAGWTPYDVFAAIEEPAPIQPKWQDAIWVVAKASEGLHRPVTDLMPRHWFRRAA